MRALVLFAVLPSLLFTACRGKPEDPVEQVRQTIVKLEEAAEKKDLGTIKDFLAPGFSDDRGNDRKGIISLLQLHFLKRSSVHILSRVGAIEVPTADTATGQVLVAVGTMPMPDIEALQGLSARLFEMNFDLVRDGDEWKVKKVRWKRARMADFLE